MGHPHEQIRNRLGEYTERIDLGDFDGVGELFATGTLADEHGTTLASGPEEVAAFYRAGTFDHGGTPRTKHLVVDTIIELDPDEAGATARSSYVVLQATDRLALQPIIAGRYHDRFAPDAGGVWRFVERRFFVDLMGDLSQHLGRRVPPSGDAG
jgi:hypothetical protein